MYFVIFWKAKFYYYKTCIIILSSLLYKDKIKRILLKNNINEYFKRNCFSEKYVLQITQGNSGEW